MEIFLEKKLESETVYEGLIFDVTHDKVLINGGKTSYRDVVHHKGGVAIAAVDGDKILLVRQYRYCTGEVLIELPAGKLDKKGESPIEAAKRELEEETGFVAGKWEDLGFIYSTPGFSNEKLYLFKAEDLTKTSQKLDYDESIDFEFVNREKVKSMIANNEIRDGKTICGIMKVLGL